MASSSSSQQQTSPQHFKRQKTVSRTVLVVDRLADRVITVGGILVILAVLGILVFLIAQTLPLFWGGRMTGHYAYTLKTGATGPVVAMTMDEYKTLVFTLSADGNSHLSHAKTGLPISSLPIDFQGQQITAVGESIDGEYWAFGFADGSVRFARTHFATEILTEQMLPPNLQPLDERDRTDGSAVYSSVPGNQFRKIGFELQLEEPIQATASQQPVLALDFSVSGEAERQLKAFAVVDAGGHVILNLAHTKLNLLTSELRTTVEQVQLPPLPPAVASQIHAAVLTKNADSFMVATRAGTVYRYNIQETGNPLLAEVTQVLPPNVTLTAFDFLLGEQSIVVGGSDHSLGIFFVVHQPDAATQDRQALIKGRVFAPTNAPITHFAAGARGKTFAVALENHEVLVQHATSQKVLARFHPKHTAAYQKMLLSPRFDGLFALQANDAVEFWEFVSPHPETTFKTLFQKVWYEGYPEPTYTWQSTGATEDFESKFSLVPLIFGTAKATLYSLLFAIPIAILGAIYTSEFLHYRMRSVVKPVMEMMASLPSVVLGFVAALVLAPIVETWLAAVLLACIVLPVALMTGAFLWQLLPVRLANRWRGVPKFSLMSAVVALAFLIAYQAGPWLEDLFFGGNFKSWLNGAGAATPFLFLILLPVSFMLVAAGVGYFGGPRIAHLMQRLSPAQAALLDMVKWVGMVVTSIVGAYLLAELLNRFGIDARGGIVGTYVQRNTLIVGFAMGFAVIPLIYTISEDALNAVPEHLRAASLGCGATPWQTAIYVVLPTAVSGVFSAIMIGMGRAVGETMIVVMAAGNTPIIDLNVFNGLRALSATIAVELPEAVKNGTLFRILFLSGLVLFAMTFVINTIAEVVRMRFRKRAAQL